MRYALALACLFLWTRIGLAASIDIVPMGPGRPDLIVVAGEIGLTDGDRFRAIAERTSNAVVAFSGPGGSIASALLMGETIRLKNFNTVVLNGDACASACALAWLGGTRRFMGQDAKVGFHAAHDAQSGDVSGLGNALVGAYLNMIGLPMQAVIYITVARPNEIKWLSKADADAFGISVEMLAPNLTRDQPSNPDNQPQSQSKMETEAIEFLTNHVRRETTAISIETVRDDYADIVFYYGKYARKNVVLSEFETFIQRWPDRRYTIRPGSVETQCFPYTKVCNLTAIIDWIAVSRPRAKRSQGYSTWSLGLVRQADRFVITSVNGQVLHRRITDLSDPVGTTQ